MHKFRLVVLPLLVLTLLACPKLPAAPASPSANLALASDTVRVTVAPCAAAAPTIACRTTITGTVGATPIAFGPAVDVPVGQSYVVAVPMTCQSLAPVSVVVSVKGVNQSGIESAAIASLPVTKNCAEDLPNLPQRPTVIIDIIRP